MFSQLLGEIVVSGLASSFAYKEAVLNLNTFVDTFTHIVNCCSGDLSPNNRFHLTACFVSNLNLAKNTNYIILVLPFKPDLCKIYINLMAQGYKFRCALCSQDSRHLCYSQGITFIKPV